jgi:hypothetical protein
VWGELSRPGSEEDQWSQQLLDAMCRVQVVISDSASAMFLTDAEIRTLRTSTDEVLKLYTRLGNIANRNGDLLFSQVPKVHWAWHLAWHAQFLSPRRGACYLDEDFVRHLKLIAQRCISGTALHAIPNMVALKYRWGMHILSSFQKGQYIARSHVPVNLFNMCTHLWFPVCIGMSTTKHVVHEERRLILQ